MNYKTKGQNWAWEGITRSWEQCKALSLKPRKNGVTKVTLENTLEITVLRSLPLTLLGINSHSTLKYPIIGLHYPKKHWWSKLNKYKAEETIAFSPFSMNHGLLISLAKNTKAKIKRQKQTNIQKYLQRTLVIFLEIDAKCVGRSLVMNRTMDDSGKKQVGHQLLQHWNIWGNKWIF